MLISNHSNYSKQPLTEPVHLRHNFYPLSSLRIISRISVIRLINNVFLTSYAILYI